MWLSNKWPRKGEAIYYNRKGIKMEGLNLYPRKLGSVSQGDISKALLQEVITIGAKYSCTVTELQELLHALAEFLPSCIVIPAQPAVSIADVANNK